ncbi:MAG: hypothetical protein GY949_09830 [Gammaproteobacteria bacterium]|nr:hypothetical protein [Gammaproteobacteria bacterium]
MRSRRTAAVFVFILCHAGTPAGVAHAADAVEALRACATVADRDARLSCYDDLGKRLLEEEPAENMSSANDASQSEAAETVTTAAVTPSLPDDLGGTAFEKESGKPENRGRVTSCKRAADKRWYFFFDNEQVWKESNTGRNRFKDCNFVATISRDGFGYQMQQEGETRKIRVKRVR